MKKLCLILPAYNEALIIKSVLKNIKKYLHKLNGIKTTIVVVDDGSSDDTNSIAGSENVIILKHVINRGLGAALATGLSFAKKNYYDLALTMDSDGQHHVNDIKKMLQPILDNQADVVTGTRMKRIIGMPIDRIIINFFSNIMTFFLFDIWTSDSQSGFRAFNQRAIRVIKLKTQGMEVSSEFFGEIKKNKLRLIEVPIKVIYTPYSRQKGQNNLNSLSIGWKLLLRLFR